MRPTDTYVDLAVKDNQSTAPVLAGPGMELIGGEMSPVLAAYKILLTDERSNVGVPLASKKCLPRGLRPMKLALLVEGRLV